MVDFLPLLGVWFLVVVSPGPDFLVTIHHATARSRRHGIAAGLGVSTAIAVWASGSMLGLALLLARVSWLYDVLRYAGAAYLLLLGVRMLWSTRGAAVAAHAPAGEHPAGAAGARAGSVARSWRAGFLTNIGNPKAAVFFGSLFGAMVPAGTGALARVLLIAVMVSVAAGWFALVASLFGLDVVARGYRRARRGVDRATAAVLILLGGRLAVAP